MRTTVLILLLLLSAACLLAQDNPSKSAGTTTIEGCLKAAGGYYTLTDSTGKVYHLYDPNSKLQGHDGHQVQITGTPRITTIEGATSTTKEESVFRVKSVKHIADTCTSK